MIIKIGTNTIDDSYSPFVKLSYEYYRNQAQEIIGGVTLYTISGKIIVTEGVSGSSVMSKLSSIRDIGRLTECVLVDIPDFYKGKARITNVNIDQGSDPSWVNQGEFSIELKAPIAVLPSNSLGLTSSDFVTDISVSELLEIGEESHSYYYGNGGFSKEFVKFTTKTSVTCRPLCSDEGTPLSKSLNVLKKFSKSTPQNTIFDDYKSWKKLLQSKNIEINTDGSVSESLSMILLPSLSSYNALVDLTFSHNQNHEEQSEKLTISGTISGLCAITDDGDIASNKLANAESAFAAIKSSFTSLGDWSGQTLQLNAKPNCPISNLVSAACRADTTLNLCIEPLTTLVSKSRTEGSISFSFEWGGASQQNCEVNGKRTEITIDVQSEAPQFVEHVIPRYGTLIQDINCLSARRVTFTSVTTIPESSCNSTLNCVPGSDDPTLDINNYIGGDYLLIGYNITSTRTSFTVRKEYIQRCKI